MTITTSVALNTSLTISVGQAIMPNTLKLTTGSLTLVDDGGLLSAAGSAVGAVDYANGRADSAVLVATVSWKLIRQGSGEVVSSGTNSVRVPYERSSQRFSTVRAARDAQVRAAKNLATIVRGQIAADLAS